MMHTMLRKRHARMATIEDIALLASSMKPTTLSGAELGTTSVREQYQQELQAVPTAENIHLSLWGGMCRMGADVFAMQQFGAKFMKAILVEKEEFKCTVCNNLKPPELMPDAGVNYS